MKKYVTFKSDPTMENYNPDRPWCIGFIISNFPSHNAAKRELKRLVNLKVKSRKEYEEVLGEHGYIPRVSKAE